jgi:hypothetical protein
MTLMTHPPFLGLRPSSKFFKLTIAFQKLALFLSNPKKHVSQWTPHISYSQSLSTIETLTLLKYAPENRCRWIVTGKWLQKTWKQPQAKENKACKIQQIRTIKLNSVVVWSDFKDFLCCVAGFTVCLVVILIFSIAIFLLLPVDLISSQTIILTVII